MKKIKVQWKLTYGILFAVFMVIAVLFLGQRAEASGFDYDIQQYHVDIHVSEQNVYTVQETIKVYFYAPRHGIYRDIPLENRVRRTNGSESQVMVKVSDISCGSDDFSVSREDDICRIKIGDKNATITGEKTYTVSYQYHMGNDVLQGADEFYYNVIGTEWSTHIQNVTFSIQFPKEFDESKLGMSYGRYGSTSTGGLKYSIVGNQVNGKLDSGIILYMGEGLTVRLELPEGYFKPENEISWEALGAILLGILTIVAGYLLWSNYGKDDPVVETVEFYAPEGINSVEAAYIYKGYLPDQDVVSLIVYLAQQGYIEIREKTGGKWNKGFALVKLRDYAGTKESERLFMAGLFQSGSVVTEKELKNTFYKTINAIGSQVKKQYEKKVFFSNSLNKNWILYLMLVGVYLAAGFRPLYQYQYSVFFAGLSLLIFGAGVTASFSVLFGKGKLFARIFSFLVIVTIVLLRGLDPVLKPLFGAVVCASMSYKIAFGFAVFVSAVVTFFAAHMSKRTPYGNGLLGKLGGFKRFLETAEKERLETMVEKNPQYFYEILPYAYVLEVSDVWMEKFESIAMEPPRWYRGYGNGRFHVMLFRDFMNSTMREAASSMTSKPRSGGGGFSGGGSGGGGGGSW